jgi:glycerol-1-phosphatase
MVAAPLAYRFDAFLIDLDGVVYVGDEALPGAAAALAELRRLDKSIAFVTNDPFDSRENYVARLAAHGIAASVEDVVTSAFATATEVARRHGPTPVAYVVGSDALRDELCAAGVECVGTADLRRAHAVVVGWHPEFCYRELRAAVHAVLGGAELYATNPDPVFPMPDGPWPATGAILAAVETASGRTGTVIGKPEPHLFRLAGSRLTGTCAVVGDRLDTDIAGGTRAGFATILVASSPPTDSVVRPDFRVSGLPDLFSG